jgi:hypothetical protein
LLSVNGNFIYAIIYFSIKFKEKERILLYKYIKRGRILYLLKPFVLVSVYPTFPIVYSITIRKSLEFQNEIYNL